VAFDGDQTSFSRLQRRLGVRDPGPALRASGAGVHLPVRRAVGLAAATCAPGRCSSASNCCMTCCRSATRCAFTEHQGHRRRGVLPRGLPAGLGGDHRQARRLAVPARAQPGLAEVQVPERPGVRHRRLHRPEGVPRRVRRAPARLLRHRPKAALRRQSRHRLRPAHPDQPARGRWPRTSGQTRLSSRSAACPGPGCTGCSPGS